MFNGVSCVEGKVKENTYDKLTDQAVIEFAKQIPTPKDSELQDFRAEALEIINHSSYHFEQEDCLNDLKGLNKGDLISKVRNLKKQQPLRELKPNEVNALWQYELHRKLFIDSRITGLPRGTWSVYRASIYGFYEKLLATGLTKPHAIKLTTSFSYFLNTKKFNFSFNSESSEYGTIRKMLSEKSLRKYRQDATEGPIYLFGHTFNDFKDVLKPKTRSAT